jgi:phage replication-related protein YjqB (UPF0714/DUF867 family)
MLLMAGACGWLGLAAGARHAAADGDDDGAGGASGNPDVPTARLQLIDADKLPSPSREFCLLDPRNRHLPGGLEAGDQLRVARPDGSDFALFTVTLSRSANRRDTDSIRLAADDLRRLGYQQADDVDGPLQLILPAVNPEITEDDARRRGEAVEIVREPPARRWLLVMAPHGGLVERGSGRMAELVVAADLPRPAALWVCKGFRSGGGAYTRWHITSTAISPRSFPGLGRVARHRYEHVLSIHGHGGREILIGGAGSAATREAVRSAIAGLDLGYSVTVRRRGQPLAGTAPTNIVNRYTNDGVQIEFPMKARTTDMERIASALAAVYAELDAD